MAHTQLSTQRRDVGDCAELAIADLGNISEFSEAGIIAQSRTVGDTPGGVVQFRVLVRNFSIVCTSSGSRRDTISSISLIVEYETCPINTVGTCASPISQTEQFQYDCGTDDDFLPPTKVIGGVSAARTETPTGTFSTTRMDQCGECAQPAANFFPDPDTHCGGIIVMSQFCTS